MSQSQFSRRDAKQRIVTLLRQGKAESRADLARELGVAPSSVSTWVAELVASGHILEGGPGESRGGRRPQRLQPAESRGQLAVAEVGGHHCRLGITSESAELLYSESHELDLQAGPEAVLGWIGEQLQQLSSRAEHGPMLAAGIALPGPVDPVAGLINMPSRMPGWAGWPVLTRLQGLLGVPVVIENDANAMALGEHRRRFGSSRTSLMVKAGTAIGAGLVIDGQLMRGSSYSAGDVTHTRVHAAADLPCSCGKVGCLETVASGAGLVDMLTKDGVAVANTADVMQLAADAHPKANTLLRQAGAHLGDALSAAIGLLNPDALFLSGALAQSEHFISEVKSRIYANCHPLTIHGLIVDTAITGPDATLLGMSYLASELANSAD